MQGGQAVLIGQVRADPTLEELADCREEGGAFRARESHHRPAPSCSGPCTWGTWADGCA